jgi:hypothetical protein
MEDLTSFGTFDHAFLDRGPYEKLVIALKVIATLSFCFVVAIELYSKFYLHQEVQYDLQAAVLAAAVSGAYALELVLVKNLSEFRKTFDVVVATIYLVLSIDIFAFL